MQAFLYALFKNLPPSVFRHVMLALVTGLACGVIAGKLNHPIVPPTGAAIGGTLVLYPLLAILLSRLL
jgi:hypothetical protein